MRTRQTWVWDLCRHSDWCVQWVNEEGLDELRQSLRQVRRSEAPRDTQSGREHPPEVLNLGNAPDGWQGH